MTRYQEDRARMLGANHGAILVRPYGDLDDGGDAGLLAALGVTGDTTDGNAPERLALVEIYQRAYADAALPALHARRFDCPCCGTVTTGAGVVCAECQRAGCLPSPERDGYWGFWACQRTGV